MVESGPSCEPLNVLVYTTTMGALRLPNELNRTANPYRLWTLHGERPVRTSLARRYAYRRDAAAPRRRGRLFVGTGTRALLPVLKPVADTWIELELYGEFCTRSEPCQDSGPADQIGPYGRLGGWFLCA